MPDNQIFEIADTNVTTVDSLPAERVIREAEFNDAVTTYWLLSGCLLCIVTIVGIPFLPIWYFGGKWITRKYLASHRCTLTNRSLKANKGIFTQIEKTVPLDRITDVGIVQGPLMRYFKIEALTVETAGQSAVGSMVHLLGIRNGREFRDAILKQRDAVVASAEQSQANPNAILNQQVATGAEPILAEILNSLHRIEARMGSA